jgi:hypothetical protein
LPCHETILDGPLCAAGALSAVTMLGILVANNNRNRPA